ncbi:NADP-dependent oxidoreductase [Luteipulveratus flavus]|uniref:NADP-dependent oxidoreductase n=1 Tax=Luteipulveratus flavus TaxID=3031728 RepID=A0ABT6C9J1_9MICO|nr:NADP-dependent oxidoreductase [Luteipulveratus sp. YIM 133296]MDF8263966.1 NADP-dependent oxidoreductase [Luteipulveratus sp. YIM 133296]
MRIFGFDEYGGPEVARELDVPDPVVAPGQVLIRTRAAGVNPADVKVRSGDRVGKVEVVFPMAMGREAAGTVVEVGDDVAHVRPGDEVFGATAGGSGALAQLVLLDGASTARRTERVSPEAAASLPVSVGTAYDACDQLGLRPGATLLVLGAGGGVGSAACQIARARGSRVLGVASEAKHDLIRSWGAEAVRSGAGWADRVRSAAPHGVDAVLDLVGEPVLRDVSGVLGEDAVVLSPAAPATAAAVAGGAGVVRRRTTEVFSEVARLVEDGALTPVIARVVPFAEAASAVEVVESGHATGNVVVTYPQD